MNSIEQGRKRIPVVKINFWDGSKYIMSKEKNRKDWRKILNELHRRKQEQFNILMENRKVEPSTTMCHIAHATVFLDEYNKVPASEELWDVQKAALGLDKRGKNKNQS